MNYTLPFGTPIPNKPHAVSVSMPHWQDVVDYEEGNARAKTHIKSGYPRFVYHPSVTALCEQVAAKQKLDRCMVWPSRKTAQLCVQYLKKSGFAGCPVLDAGYGGIHAVAFPEAAAAAIKEYWMHAGLIVSSRLADAALAAKPFTSGEETKQLLRRRIAVLSEMHADDVYLYPSGMGAIYAAHLLVCALKPGAKTIQLGFPYVDTLKIQQKMGQGGHYIDYRESADLQQVEAILAHEPIAAVFCEFPTNPLLHSIDFESLGALLKKHQVPLIVDDTVGTWFNVGLKNHADIQLTSLTKFFSGVGDVLGGSLQLNHRSDHYQALKVLQGAAFEDLLYAEDATLLDLNSEDFSQRMQRINSNAEQLADFLCAHAGIAEVFYPKTVNPETYRKHMKQGGGYGGLISFILKDEAKAPAVYDHLDVNKGPSLGTNYTLVCPYTLLAHYRELDFAKESAVLPSLIRVSVGLEDPAVLIRIFADALEYA